MRHTLALSFLIGLLVAFLVYAIPSHSNNAGDFAWALSTAQAIVESRDPYDFVADALHVPYPLPVALFGLPLIWLPTTFAAAIFVGLSSAILAWGIFRSGEPWRLWVFASFPFFTALYFRQWSPLITAAWFVPVLAPLLVLIKPQIALPVAVERVTGQGLLLALGVLLVSLIYDATWPIRWMRMLGPYERVVPVLELPFGPLLLLALLRWRDSHARLLLFMSVLPMRGLYDLCPLWLIPKTRQYAARLALLSWTIYPLMAIEAKTSLFVVPILYLPALGSVLWPTVSERRTRLLEKQPYQLMMVYRRQHQNDE